MAPRCGPTGPQHGGLTKVAESSGPPEAPLAKSATNSGLVEVEDGLRPGYDARDVRILARLAWLTPLLGLPLFATLLLVALAVLPSKLLTPLLDGRSSLQCMLLARKMGDPTTCVEPPCRAKGGTTSDRRARHAVGFRRRRRRRAGHRRRRRHRRHRRHRRRGSHRHRRRRRRPYEAHVRALR
jgi:hypothetical protein